MGAPTVTVNVTGDVKPCKAGCFGQSILMPLCARFTSV
ncbi:hypothetical protein SpAn4DRAFT_4721 [Sporomusa ovata]|uniref:Uncharacterized protein n=1 Tax=Sporomusa ovata TaxID=2378 RepID=A0A0U1KX88_9FIRM|nr:hypothetical protein SpAn4DRAFT_4721 [Sporomusa ovata]